MRLHRGPYFIEADTRSGIRNFDTYAAAERSAKLRARRLHSAVGIYNRDGLVADVVPKVRAGSHVDLTPIGATIV